MKLKQTEHELQKDIIDYLNEREKRYKNIYFIRNNSFSGKITRPNGSTGWVKNNKPGAPDIVLCHKGTWIGLELKSVKGKQSPDQKKAEELIRKAGGQYFVIKSIEEFKSFCDVLEI